MDSCENRLESLRMLYDAGILDREEYAERVARVKALHGKA
ncbi:MAG: SHOCT domain-containing protein [Oscillospiraceae bacterium]|nr:SHOCT domain-containing protein [Oscillospiraceae bacterium]